MFSQHSNLCSENVSKMKHCKETYPISYEYLLRPHLCIVFIFFHCPCLRILLNPMIAFKKYNTSVIDYSHGYTKQGSHDPYTCLGREREGKGEPFLHAFLYLHI